MELDVILALASWAAFSNSVDINWQCDVAILATRQPGMNLERLIAKGVHILDCTNSLNGQSGVTAL